MTLNVEFHLVGDIIHSVYSFVAMGYVGKPPWWKKKKILAWRKKTRLCFVQYAFISELTSAIALTNRFHLFPVIIDANSTTTAPYSREPHLISHFPQLYPHSFITIEFIPTMSTPPDNISIWKELWSAGETPWTLPSLNPALKKHGASFAESAEFFIINNHWSIYTI